MGKGGHPGNVWELSPGFGQHYKSFLISLLGLELNPRVRK